MSDFFSYFSSDYSTRIYNNYVVHWREWTILILRRTCECKDTENTMAIIIKPGSKKENPTLFKNIIDLFWKYKKLKCLYFGETYCTNQTNKILIVKNEHLSFPKDDKNGNISMEKKYILMWNVFTFSQNKTIRILRGWNVEKWSRSIKVIDSSTDLYVIGEANALYEKKKKNWRLRYAFLNGTYM